MFRTIVTILIAFFISVPVTAAFSDIENYPQKSAIEALQSSQVVQGYDDGTFRPYAPIDRAEFLKIIMLASFNEDSYKEINHRCFGDFSGEEQWFWIHACAAQVRGIVQGHPDGTFRGENTINLAEALKMTMKTFNVTLPQYIRAPDHWYDPYMDAAHVYGIYQIVPFKPDHQMTRGEMAAIVVAIQDSKAIPAGSTGELYIVEFPPAFSPVCGNGIWEEGEQCDDGNVENSDGCSSICILVSEPIRHGALRIDQRTIANEVQASGTDGVTLLSFDVIAGRQDVYITTLKFRSDGGSLTNANNYELYIDRDGDGITETLFGRAVAQGDKLAFPELSILVRDGALVRVEVRGDLINTLSAGSIAMGFDTSLLDFVEGVDREDGEDVVGIRLNDEDCSLESICWIRVNTQTARTVTVGLQGSLYVMEDSTPVPSKQLLAGTLSDVLLRLKLRTESEGIIVKSMTIAGGTASIDRLELYGEGATTPFAIARTSQCATIVVGQFCTTDEFVIAQGAEKKILVKALVNSDERGAVSGEAITLSLTAATTGTVAVTAEGWSSGQQISQNDGDRSVEGEIFIGLNGAGANNAITGSTHDIVDAQITSITNVHSDPDLTPVPAGDVTFGLFRFQAAAHSNSFGGLNDVVIDQLVFNVGAINVEIDSADVTLYNAQDASVSVSCTASDSTGSMTVTCSGLEASVVSTAIAQGNSLELGLRTTVINPKVTSGTSTLQASLQSLSNRSITTTIHWNDEVSSFEWVDIGTTNVQSVMYRTD